MVAKIGTNADCITCWPNFQPMQVAFYFAGEITQVKESIPWVRCASGNVRSYRGIGDQGEVDSGVGDQVGLELGEVNVEGTIKSQRGRDGGDDLAD